MAEGAGQTLGIDWGMVGAVIAFFAFVGMVLYQQHGQLLAQVKDEKDRARYRARLIKDAGIAQRFRDGIAGLITRIDAYFGPRLGWRAFERCLLHAYLYPAVLFVGAWAAGASGALGTIPLLAEVGVWHRVRVFAFLVLLLGCVFLIFASTPLLGSAPNRWTKRYIGRWVRRALDLGNLAPWVELPKAPLLFLSFSSMAYFGFVLSVVAAVLAAAAASFDVVDALAGSGVIASTIFIIGAFFVVLSIAFTVIFPDGSSFATLCFVLISYVAFSHDTSGNLETAATLLTFYLALPIANGFLDWVSWAWTRWLLRSPADGEGATRSVTSIAARLLGDLGLAFVSLCLLALLLPNVIEATNRLFAWLEWPTITWLPLLNQALEAPFTQGLFVTGMLLTTLVPTLLHVVAGLFGVFAVWGGGGPAMAARIPADPTAPMAESDCQAVAWFLLRRRLWLIPATIATVMLVVPLAWGLSLFIGPIGLFLADLALCGTSWSHGLCPFFD